MESIRNMAAWLFSLREDQEDEQKTIESIRKGVVFRGTNLWILVFAIFVASIGLNTNSTAVIIGAMLISPLMGPIMGAGVALGINDFDLLRQSLKNLGIATLIGLFTSALYFLLSPIDEAHSELLARTYPTIYDVLIAFFGGLAGIVAGSRTEKSNAIPGVAIATALMPPLCTAGYGLATWQARFFFGAFYLYLINCVFICLATLAVVRYLKYPKVTFLDAQRGRRIRRILAWVIVLMVVPSIYLAWQLVERTSFESRVNRYIAEVFEKHDHPVMWKKIHYATTPRLLEVAVLGEQFTSEQIQDFQVSLGIYGLGDTELKIRKDRDLNNAEAQTQSETTKRLRGEIARLNTEVTKYSSVAELSPQLLKEAQALSPNIVAVRTALGTVAGDQGEKEEIMVLLSVNGQRDAAEEKRLKDWMTARLSTENSNVKVIFVSRETQP